MQVEKKSETNVEQTSDAVEKTEAQVEDKLQHGDKDESTAEGAQEPVKDAAETEGAREDEDDAAQGDKNTQKRLMVHFIAALWFSFQSGRLSCRFKRRKKYTHHHKTQFCFHCLEPLLSSDEDAEEVDVELSGAVNGMDPNIRGDEDEVMSEEIRVREKKPRAK